MIKITDFAERHFDKTFGGTKILDITKEKFEECINSDSDISDCFRYADDLGTQFKVNGYAKLIPGYAPFCRLLIIENFTNASVGSMPITLENYQYLRSGYSARRDSELPTFSRWLELPVAKPKAEYLVLVLYSKEQIEKEALVEYKKIEYPTPLDAPKSFDAEWGVVAILGQSHGGEEPMKPETMTRNALGIKEGGSGVPLDRDKYMESVAFWDKNATVK